MTVKRWLTHACITLGALTGVAHAATLDQIKEKGVMTVATEDDYRPFEYIQDGKPVGLDHDLLELLRKSSSFKINQTVMPWSGLLPGVTTGKYDVALTAVVVTPERAQSLDFAMPIAEATQYYVVRADENKINAVADLSGKTVGVQAGGGSFAALSNLEKLLSATGGSLGKVVQYPSFPEAYQDLSNGRLDYVINGAPNLASLVAEHPSRFKMGQAVGEPTYAAWAVAKGNTSVLNYLNEFMSKIRADGSLYQLQNKWLGMTFESMPVNPVTAP